MEKFARIVVGYHGCPRSFADAMLTGKVPFTEWRKSQNTYDWLGEGIYFWEHSPTRALRWASERFGKRAAVLGAVIQLGACFDLLDEKMTSLLAASYPKFAAQFAAAGKPLPINKGTDKKLRELDCAVINDCLDRWSLRNFPFDTVRGAFLEGPSIFPGTTISAKTRIQIAVRNVDCILGVFRPNLIEENGMLHRQPTIEELKAALEATELPPLEGFERMIRHGIINREGRLTKLCGGEAEPEPGARRPTDATDSDDNGQV